MKIRDYEHLEGACKLGKVFGVWGSILDPDLTQCPKCMEPVQRINTGSTVEAPAGKIEPDSMPNRGSVTQDCRH